MKSLRTKNIHKEKYNLDAQGVDLISQHIYELLSEYKDVSKRDILRIRLSAEELMLRWIDEVGESPAKVELIAERHGRYLDLVLKLHGVSYRIDAESSDDDADVAKDITARLGIDWIYQYVGGKNSAYIALEIKKTNNVIKVLLAILLALVVSAVLRISPANDKGIYNLIVNPIITACSNFLRAIVTPMMLLAVISGILNIGSPRLFSKVGKRVCTSFILSTLVTAMFAALICFVRYGVGVDDTSVLYTEGLGFLTYIIPNNIITPFVDENMIQILVMGLIIGIAMLFLQRRVGMIGRLVDEANVLVIKILSGFEIFIPAFIFVSMLEVGLTAELESIVQFTEVIIVFGIFIVAVTGINFFITAAATGISVRRLWKVLKPSIPVHIASASLSMCFDEAFTACERGFGIDSKLINFALSIGTLIHKPLMAAEFMFVIYATANIYGNGMGIKSMLLLMILSVIMSMAYPPVSGGEISCYTVLMSWFKLDPRLFIIWCTLSTLFDIMEVPCNSLCTDLQLLTLAHKNNMITHTDKKEYAI